ncbi:MAG: anti-sigma factor, partial [Aeromicrobium sp.]
LDVGSHLEVCGSCREELAQLAVGHALLARSARTLDSAEPEAPLPPLSLPRTRPNRALLVAAAAAAVVGLVAGGVATSAFTDRSTSPPPTSQPSALAAARLTPVGGEDPAVRGQVEMYRAEAGHTRMEIRTSELPSAGAGRFYYAWLLDPVTQKMLPLGQVGPDGGTFDVADTALASYAAVDISLEDDDGDPAHSVTSVLRGSY